MAERVTPTAVLVAPAALEQLDRDAWLEVRRQGVGSSDIAAILGFDQYRKPLHVWHDKLGLKADDRPARVAEAARWGHRFEALIAEVWAEETGNVLVRKPGTLARVDEPWMLANLDRLVIEPDWVEPSAVLEVKNRSAWQSHEWGLDDDTLPDGPALQAHWQIAVTGYDHAFVAALIGGNSLRWYRIDRDDEMVGYLVDAARRFWREHVLAGEPPPVDGSTATTELLERLWAAQPGEVVEVDPGQWLPLLAKRAELRRAIEDAEAELGEIENRMRAALGPAEIAVIDSCPAWTWRRNGTFAAKRFREAEPQLAQAYLRKVDAVDLDLLKTEQPDTYARYRARVLRVPKEK